MFGAPLSWLSGYLPPPSTQEFDLMDRFDEIESQSVREYDNFPKDVKYQNLKNFKKKLDFYIFSFVYSCMTKGENMKNIVKLESIGTALNMKTGMTHPINADGTIDFYDGVATHILYDEGGFDEDGFELYDLADLKDREVIEEYLETTK